MTHPDFQAYQLALTRHLRDPEHVARPDGTKKKRVKIYADLLYNNLNGFLENSFPVLRRILRKKRWHRLVQAFFSGHRSPSPLFRDIPRFFLDFLTTADRHAFDLPAFTLELAHYEWLELKVDTDPRKIRWPGKRPLDHAAPLRINPTLELNAYRYPVHRIGPQEQTDTEPETATFLAVWRDRAHEVRFMSLSAPAAQLLHELQQGKTLDEAILAIAPAEAVRTAAREQIDNWLNTDIIVGNKRRRRR